MSSTDKSTDAEWVVARAICSARFKDRQLDGEPRDADVEHVRHLAKAAITALRAMRTIQSAADVPIRAVAYNEADGSIVARFDQDHGVVFGDDRPFPWHDRYLRGPFRLLWHPSDDPTEQPRATTR